MAIVIPNAQNPPTFPGQAVSDETDWTIIDQAKAGNGPVSGCTCTAPSLNITNLTYNGASVIAAYTGNGGTIPTNTSITVSGSFGVANVTGIQAVTGGGAGSVNFTAASVPTGAYTSGGVITGMFIAVAAGEVSYNETNYLPSAAYVAVAGASQTDRRDLVVYQVGTGFTSSAATAGCEGTPNLVGAYPVKPLLPSNSVGLGEAYVAGTYGTPPATTALANGNVIDKTGYIPTSGVTEVVAKTNNYLFLATDSPNFFTFNGSSLSASLPAVPPSLTWHVAVLNLNSTSLTLSPNGLNFNGASVSLTIPQNQGVSVRTDGANYFYDHNPSSGGVTSISNGYGITGAIGSTPQPAVSLTEFYTDLGSASVKTLNASAETLIFTSPSLATGTWDLITTLSLAGGSTTGIEIDGYIIPTASGGASVTYPSTTGLPTGAMWFTQVAVVADDRTVMTFMVKGLQVITAGTMDVRVYCGAITGTANITGQRTGLGGAVGAIQASHFSGTRVA